MPHVNPDRLAAAAAAAVLLLLTGCSRAEPVQLPTVPNPVPTFDGVPRARIMTADPLRIEPGPDAQALYQRVLDCYPARSLFRAELSGEVRAAQRSATFDNGAAGSGAALVLRVPLYSSAEIDRERERESARRSKAAAAVGQFVEQLVQWRLTDRELMIWKRIEARSADRVAIGVTETAEQLEAEKRVYMLESKRVEQLALLTRSRLELIGMCGETQAPGLNAYMQRFHRIDLNSRAEGGE